MKSLLLLLITVSATVAQSWEPCAPLPSARYSGSALVLGGKIYYVGGSLTGGLKTNTVYTYDPAGDSWSLGESLPDARHRFGAVSQDSSIYVFGGWGDGGVLLNTGYRYIESDRAWVPIETLPARRASVFAAAGQTLAGKVYCIGGWDGAQAHNTNYEYNPATGHWRERAPMHAARCEGACVWYDGPLCIGGTTDGGTLLDLVESYDEWADTWYTWIPSPVSRMAMAGVTDTRCLWVLGGAGAGNLALRDNYEIDYHGIWRDRLPLPEARRYLAACYVPDDTMNWSGHIYVIGGLDSLMQPTATVWRWLAPLGVAELPAAAPARFARTSFVRPGATLPSPLGPMASGVVVSADGRVVGRVRAGARLPVIAPGAYVARWQVQERCAVTRLVVPCR